MCSDLPKGTLYRIVARTTQYMVSRGGLIADEKTFKETLPTGLVLASLNSENYDDLEPSQTFI